MKSMLLKTVALSACTLILTGAALAAEPAKQAAQDAQFGEVAKSKDATTQTAPAATGAEAAGAANVATTSNYSDAELKTFVDAAKDVDKVKLKYEGKLSTAKGPDADKIKKEADVELSKAVEAKGLSVEQYNKIHQSAMQDPQLLARIQKHM